MLKSHEIAAIPGYFLINYPKFISDKEFIMLLHFQAIQRCDKEAWKIVSERMGYKNMSQINKMLSNLEEKDYITVTRGEIDATNLYDKCADGLNITQPIETEVVKKDNTHYKIAGEILPLINADSLDGLARRIKTLLKKYTQDDIMGTVGFLNSWYQHLSEGKPTQYKIAFSVLNEQSIQKWIDGGKKEQFVKENKKKKEFTEI